MGYAGLSGLSVSASAQSLGADLALVVVEERCLVRRLVLPQLRRLAVERALHVGVAQHALDGQEHRAHVVRRRPLLLENVEADVAVLVHIGVVAGRLKLDRGRRVGVVLGEGQRQLERQPLVDLGWGGLGVGGMGMASGVVG